MMSKKIKIKYQTRTGEVLVMGIWGSQANYIYIFSKWGNYKKRKKKKKKDIAFGGTRIVRNGSTEDLTHQEN